MNSQGWCASWNLVINVTTKEERSVDNNRLFVCGCLCLEVSSKIFTPIFTEKDIYRTLFEIFLLHYFLLFTNFEQILWHLFLPIGSRLAKISVTKINCAQIDILPIITFSISIFRRKHDCCTLTSEMDAST